MKTLANIAIVIAFLSAAGCGRDRPIPADADVARTTLRTTLDAWKKGDAADSLTKQTPPIYVAEREWKNGARLADYEVDPKDQLFGSDLRCNVWLTMKDGNGRERKKKATYSVGTNNKLTVVREDDE
jgi:hypothetical protein